MTVVEHAEIRLDLTEGEKIRLERGTSGEIYWGSLLSSNNSTAGNLGFDEIVGRIEETEKYSSIRVIKGSFDPSGKAISHVNDIWVTPRQSETKI